MIWELTAYYTLGNQSASWEREKFTSDTRKGVLDLFCAWIRQNDLDKIDLDIRKVEND